ncbi:MAG: hypothetical protein ACRCWF_06695 [Beijerinckiaceae bacterium]
MKRTVEVALKYDMLRDYLLSQPKEIVVTAAQFGKPASWFNVAERDGLAFYCLMIETQNPAIEGWAGRVTRTFSVRIFQDVKEPSKLDVSLVTNLRNRGVGCSIRDGVDVPQLIGHRYRR